MFAMMEAVKRGEGKTKILTPQVRTAHLAHLALGLRKKANKNTHVVLCPVSVAKRHLARPGSGLTCVQISTRIALAFSMSQRFCMTTDYLKSSNPPPLFWGVLCVRREGQDPRLLVFCLVPGAIEVAMLVCGRQNDGRHAAARHIFALARSTQ